MILSAPGQPTITASRPQMTAQISHAIEYSSGTGSHGLGARGKLRGSVVAEVASSGRVGAAERDEAGGPELFCEVGGGRPGYLTQRPQAERGGLTRDRAGHVLVQDRDAAERAVGQVAVGLQPRRLEPGRDHGIQPRVDRFHPGDGSLGQLLGAHLAAAH